jgi:hypothetical protein
MASKIVLIKNGRSVRYAMTRNALGADDNLPLLMVDDNGNATTITGIRPLAHGGQRLFCY